MAILKRTRYCREEIMNLMKVLPIASMLAFLPLSAFAQQPPSEVNPSKLGFFDVRPLIEIWFADGGCGRCCVRQC
jgi:hypothetical protein